jgi:hypothetical protein
MERECVSVYMYYLLTLTLTIRSPPLSMTDTRILRVHIRTISTNAIHPQAQQSPLQLTIVPKHYREDIFGPPVLQIAYDVVAVHFHDDEGEMRAVVWDWTTSDLLLVRSNLRHFATYLISNNTGYLHIFQSLSRFYGD